MVASLPPEAQNANPSSNARSSAKAWVAFLRTGAGSRIHRMNPARAESACGRSTLLRQRELPLQRARLSRGNGWSPRTAVPMLFGAMTAKNSSIYLRMERRWPWMSHQWRLSGGNPQASVQSTARRPFLGCSPDGRRFLMAAPSSGSAAVQTPFTIVLNWQAALKK